jgi:hypothetical protein
MKKEKPIKIGRCRGPTTKGLYWLKEIETNHNYIPWKKIFLKLCRNWSLSKQEVRQTIMIFYELEFLEISPKGVKLNYEIVENEK